MDADKDNAMRSGADGYIHKSFNLDNFISDIGAALNKCLGIRAKLTAD
jgi:DNA-binding response OmpR family regulator